PGLSAAERNSRIGVILEVLKAIPDEILRYEEYRKVSQYVGTPVDVLWGGRKRNLRPVSERLQPEGTQINGTVLSIPAPELRVLRVLAQGGDLKPLVFSRLRGEWLTTDPAKEFEKLLRSAAGETERVDFRGQIDQLKQAEHLPLFSSLF